MKHRYIGLNEEQIDEIFIKAGIKNGESLDVNTLLKTITELVIANNKQIVVDMQDINRENNADFLRSLHNNAIANR